MIYNNQEGGETMDYKLNDLDSNLVVRVNKEKRLKANFILKTKGRNLTTAIREMVYKLAEEFDEAQKK